MFQCLQYNSDFNSQFSLVLRRRESVSVIIQRQPQPMSRRKPKSNLQNGIETPSRCFRSQAPQKRRGYAHALRKRLLSNAQSTPILSCVLRIMLVQYTPPPPTVSINRLHTLTSPRPSILTLPYAQFNLFLLPHLTSIITLISISFPLAPLAHLTCSALHVRPSGLQLDFEAATAATERRPIALLNVR
jgi:hypothetical protein